MTIPYLQRIGMVMDVTAIAAALIAMSQYQTQDKVGLNLVQMDANAEQAVANMLIENARQIQALTHEASGGQLDVYA
jgi:hypothetical protein